MKKQVFLAVSMFTLALSAVSPLSQALAQTANVTAIQQKNLNLDQAIAEINQKQPISTYSETAFTSTNILPNNKKETYTIQRKIWDNTIKNELRKEEFDKDSITYYVSKGGKSKSYKAGDKEAVLYPAGVTAIADNEINHTKQKLKRLKEEASQTDSKMTFNVVEESFLNRPVYHFSRKKEDVFQGKTHVYLTDLWVDKKTGFLLKETINDNNGTQVSEYTVTKVNFNPTFNEKDFTLDLPKGVKLVESSKKKN
ncbi:hypothetical protein ABE137_06550 [Brevibacillus laterosporus]|uniref:LolA family protein n=1 Tax=Brevibacillus laterosporus TaxID=1465 RepID=UPI0009E024A9